MSLSSSSLRSYASQYPATRSFDEISVWAWIAAAVLLVAVLAAVLAPNKSTVPIRLSGVALAEQLMPFPPDP
jgi:hypothetical protein